MQEPTSGGDGHAEPQGMPSEVALENVTLAYLTCPQDGAKGFLGALLVTDGRTRPLHFAFVNPIRPTAIQRIVYGATLNEHAKVDVIARTLLKEKSSHLPDVVFTDSEDLLVVRRVAEVPTAWLRAADDSRTSLTRFVYDTGGNRADEEQVGRIVALLEQSVNLLDPFERMKEALKEVLRAEKA